MRHTHSIWVLFYFLVELFKIPLIYCQNKACFRNSFQKIYWTFEFFSFFFYSLTLLLKYRLHPPPSLLPYSSPSPPSPFLWYHIPQSHNLSLPLYLSYTLVTFSPTENVIAEAGVCHSTFQSNPIIKILCLKKFVAMICWYGIWPLVSAAL